MEGKSFEKIVDEVYESISKVLDMVDAVDPDVGGIVSLALRRNLDPFDGVVQGGFNERVSPDDGMRNMFVLFCVALLQSGVKGKDIRNAVENSIKKCKQADGSTD